MMQHLDEMSIEQILTEINNHDQKVPLAVKQALPQLEHVVKQVIETIEQGGKIVYMGAGTSGRLGILDASECPPTFGVSPELFTGMIAGGEKAIRYAVEDAEDNIELGRLEVAERLTEKDFLIGIAASGRTPYVIGGIESAKERNIPTAAIVCVPNSPLSQLVDYPVEIIVGEEVVKGSTRMKAGTAQKLALNMISTTSMVKLGKVYQNYMVDVQATNKKLRKRTVDIVRELTDVSEETAKAALKACQGNLKAAVLVCQFSIDYKTANETIQACQGNLRAAMKQLQCER
ncbi:N-acetylmuramic acid 6-phosphate etherase [Cerasibacillus quisquiliarum]|uniref:N-acetylmuramic acid 6-phosphate etherase n=2 Tax=Cerasibacillus quisquiliarum TaxID=227865 RepID=A0A511UTN5_9BACI|nr:N-acetylmuramic acid 6-phosphate etherase [Cerasibacillus quisquiliarum]GEN29944.1 N-acetylmuramic acid 6-phosphate etherase [Cerasibacillus quisquiliarum]